MNATLSNWLDAQTTALLEVSEGQPPLCALPVEQARQALDEIARLSGGVRVEVGRVEDRVIPGPGGDIGVRIYWPDDTGAGRPRPLLMFFHGGGFALGSTDTHDDICRALCKDGDVIVVSVDYRRSPEHKFPAAPEDCHAALLWAKANAENLGGDDKRIAVCGDSAGGNLSAVVAQMARDRGGPQIAYQILIYPNVDADPAFQTDSRTLFGNGDYFLSHDDIIWIIGMYVPQGANLASPYLSPLRAGSLASLPPALVITAGCDPLRDEGRMYAERLAAAGVPAELKCFETTIHGFVSMSGAIDAGKEALALIASRLRSQLHAES